MPAHLKTISFICVFTATMSNHISGLELGANTQPDFIQNLSVSNNRIEMTISLSESYLHKMNPKSQLFNQAADIREGASQPVRWWLILDNSLPSSIRILNYTKTEYQSADPGLSYSQPDNISRYPIPFPKNEPFLKITSDTIPDSLLQIRNAGSLRGFNIFSIELLPFHFRKDSQKIDYYRTLDIRIELQPQDDFIPRHSLSPAFKRLFDQLSESIPFLENSSYDWHEQDHLLLLGPQTFLNAMEPFLQWKQQRGFTVTATPLETIGTTAAEIKTYIQTVYESWENPPGFVLLVGSTDSIPSFAGMRYPDSTAQFNYPSDLYFGTFDGPDDFLPEVFIGRLPARDTADLQAMIQKIITYEQTDVNNSAWMNRVSFVASGDPNFHTIVENTHRYAIENFLIPRELTVDSIWIYSGGTTNDIENTVNTGTNLLCYSGHGTEYIWQDPNTNPAVFFWSQNIGNLSNSTAFPLVLSFGCNAGTFGTAIPSLGEDWLYPADRGGVSFWGASNLTFWYEDDYLERRFWDATFSGYLQSLGEMTLYSLLEVWSRGYPTGEYYLEIYNLLGDPTLNLRFTAPDSIRGALTGIVSDAVTSESLSNQEIHVTSLADPLLPGFSMIADSAGQFSSPGLLPAGHYQLTAVRSGYHSLVDTIQLNEGINSDTLLMLPLLPASLSGRIFYPGGVDGADSASVWIRGQNLHTTTSQDGNYLFETIMPDSVVISIYKRGFTWLTDTLVLSDEQAITDRNYTLTTGATERLFSFEQDNEDFIYLGDWEWGLPGQGLYLQGPMAAYSGTGAVATVMDGDYSSLSDSRLETPLLLLDNFTHATLSFYHYFNMDHINSGFDGGNVKISTDNGQTWELIYPEEGYTVTALSSLNPILAGEPAFSGSQPQWQLTQFNIDPYLDSPNGIHFAFHFASTSQVEDVGWYLDNISLQDRLPQATVATDPKLPTQISLGQNYPNPFNRVSIIPFDLPYPGTVILEIHDVSGKQVKSFQQSYSAAGSQQVVWDGKNDAGQIVTSGVYLYRIKFANEQQMKKLILLK